MDFPKKRSEFNAWIDAKNKDIMKFKDQRAVMYPNLEEQLDLCDKQTHNCLV